jgi:hypothetical protein
MMWAVCSVIHVTCIGVFFHSYLLSDWCVSIMGTAGLEAALVW